MAEEEQFPWDEQVRRIQGISDEGLRNEQNLGAQLAFHEAPRQRAEISQILQDLRAENLSDFNESLRTQIAQRAEQVANTLESMQTVDPRNAPLRDQLETQLKSDTEWFVDNVKPRLRTAPMRRAAEEAVSNLTTDADREAREAARQEMVSIQEQLVSLRPQIQSLADLGEVARAEAGRGAGEDLASYYSGEATRHAKDWKIWGRWVVAAAILAVAGSAFVALFHRPSGDITNAKAFARLVFDLLVIGILLYVLRLTSLQFRVHRHLEAVARNKAAALSTFSRIVVVTTETTVRDAVAAELARAVFKSDETGFVDAGSDHITLVERLASVVPRPPG